MTGTDPMVWVLLGVAVVSVIGFLLAALGRVPLGMDPPEEPWWQGRGRRRRRRSRGRSTDRATVQPSQDPQAKVQAAPGKPTEANDHAEDLR
ncbi:MAG: hypothetical protein Q4G40_10610 [Brachybacterium sp.]|nr:hypothetical protein [Brachybacterium sp.]